MRVSFVIPAWNEADELPATLAALGAAAREVLEDGEWEVVVVDDASTDATGELAREAGARVVTGEWRQIARVRNAGAAAARGERLVFIDADTHVDATLLRAAFEALDQGAVGGGARIRFRTRVPLAIRVPAKLFLWLLNACGFVGGCFVFARRADFEAVGGFDETLFASEEIALAKALKKRGRFRVLRATVASSARKLETWSFWEITWMTLRMALRGRRGLETREGLEVWYGERRRLD